jgi:hypothetical protein
MKKLYLKWVYNKLFKNEEPNLMQVIKHYLHVTRTLSFNIAVYKVRRRYSLTLKTRNFEQFQELSEKILGLVKAGVVSSDIIAERHTKRKVTNLDAWLVTSTGVPVNETDAATEILNYAKDIVRTLDELEKKNPPIAFYYNQNLKFYLLELIEVLDALIALELGVEHGRRYGQALITGRQRTE